MNRRAQEGFTLIEILTVIIIIGVLSGILLPVLVNARVRMRAQATKADISAVETACEGFKADMGLYPPDQHYSSSDMPGGTAVAILGGALRTDVAFTIPGDRAKILRDPENGSTKTLVYMLGSHFDIQGKRYGPYIRFKLSRLRTQSSGDSTRNYLATGYTAAGNVLVNVTGAGGTISGGWPVLVLSDWFGNNYVYDSHFPENRILIRPPHNASSFDMYSFGPICRRGSDGLIADEDINRPGENEDDINNWR
jgi:prepilin-type N-terminal cleavage/methylation domain-containing protein